LAIPVVKGEKSPTERFAGAERTYTIEALMQNGWALQSGTSHFLGENFARAFNVTFQSATGSRELVHATSWGVSTRLVGALLMTHSDDAGVVLPPSVAPLQVVLVPILTGKSDKDSLVLASCQNSSKRLKSCGVRVKVDDRTSLRHGAKYFEWEQKGVPLRIEIGPRDVQNNTFVLVKRLDGTKGNISLSSLEKEVQQSLVQVQQEMLSNARARLQAKTFSLTSYGDMKKLLDNKDTTGFYLVPWRCNSENESAIKADCKVTLRCYPDEHNQAPPEEGVKCFYSGEQATHYALFARAF
jgi:prolyl-tRNA synthetase